MFLTNSIKKSCFSLKNRLQIYTVLKNTHNFIIKINYINVISAGNDCVDLSFGKYEIEEININDCGDKAISVGEKSKLLINKLNVLNSKIGIASKDSSKTKLENGYFKHLDTCLSAYNKKQEFIGGFIEINNFDCLNSTNKIFVDDMSSINLNS